MCLLIVGVRSCSSKLRLSIGRKFPFDRRSTITESYPNAGRLLAQSIITKVTEIRVFFCPRQQEKNKSSSFFLDKTSFFFTRVLNYSFIRDVKTNHVIIHHSSVKMSGITFVMQDKHFLLGKLSNRLPPILFAFPFLAITKPLEP